MSKFLNKPEKLFMNFAKNGCLAENSKFKYNSVADILKSSTYLLPTLITIEYVENRLYSLDLIQNADLKISLYVCVHIKTMLWKFRIPNPKNFRVICSWSFGIS